MSVGGIEGEIRKKIIEDDKVDCMIALPSGLFFTTGIPACLWIFAKNKNNGKTRKRNNEILFIDARKIFTPIDRVQNELSPEQIERIAGTYRSYIEEIDEDDEPFEQKMERLVSEYAKLSEESKKLDKEIHKNLKELGFEN